MSTPYGVAQLSITYDAVYTALGSFIASVLGIDPAQVVQGYWNRLPMPLPAWINMTIISQTRLRTNQDTLDVPPNPVNWSAEQGTQLDIQLDCYGPQAGDWAQILTTVLRDEVAVTALAPTFAPFHADDAIRAPLTNAEQEFEDRWIVTLRGQVNPVVTTKQQYATALGPVQLTDVL